MSSAGPQLRVFSDSPAGASTPTLASAPAESSAQAITASDVKTKPAPAPASAPVPHHAPIKGGTNPAPVSAPSVKASEQDYKENSDSPWLGFDRWITGTVIALLALVATTSGRYLFFTADSTNAREERLSPPALPRPQPLAMASTAFSRQPPSVEIRGLDAALAAARREDTQDARAQRDLALAKPQSPPTVVLPPRPPVKPIAKPDPPQSDPPKPDPPKPDPPKLPAPPPTPIPTTLTLLPVPSMRRLGEPLLVVARVSGAQGEPVPGVQVDWSLDRHGVGEILAAGGGTPAVAPSVAANSRPPDPTPSGRVNPTYGRCWTVGNFSGPLPNLPGVRPLQAGEAWCLVDTTVPGEMALSVVAPGLDPSFSRAAVARVHWDRARLEVQTSAKARVGTAGVLSARVVDYRDSVPLAGYRVRWTVDPSQGALLDTAEGGTNVVAEAVTLSNGDASARVRQPRGETTKLRVELLGRQTTPGPAIVLQNAATSVEWWQPQLSLSASEAKAAVGEWAEARFRASNPDRVPHAKMVVTIPLGWEIPSGIPRASNEIVLGELNGSTEQFFTLAVRAVQPSKQPLQAELRDGTTILARAGADVEFASPQLVIERDRPAWRLGAETSYTITVRNRGTVQAHSVQLIEEIPAGIKAYAADAEMSSGQLSWNLGDLSPGDKRQVHVTASANTLVAGALRTRVHGRGGPSAEVMTPVQIAGVPGLEIHVIANESLVRAGGAVDYRVIVVNRGTALARDVQLEALTPAGLRLLGVEGALPATLNEGSLRWGSIPALAPGERMESNVRARALQAPEARLSILLRHGSVGINGLLNQETTRIYD